MIKRKTPRFFSLNEVPLWLGIASFVLFCLFFVGCNGDDYITVIVDHCEIDVEMGGLKYRCVEETYVYDKKSGSWPKNLFIKARITTPLNLITQAGDGQAELEVRAGESGVFQNVGVNHSETKKEGNTYEFVSNQLPDLPNDAVSHYEMRWRSYSLKEDDLIAEFSSMQSTTIMGIFGNTYSRLTRYIDPQDTSAFCNYDLIPEYGYLPVYPTLTQWGLIILVILVVGSGIWLMLKRRRAVRV